METGQAPQLLLKDKDSGGERRGGCEDLIRQRCGMRCFYAVAWGVTGTGFGVAFPPKFYYFIILLENSNTFKHSNIP